MATVTCEKTGIEFEAKSARTKNHPAIMRVLDEANRYGWYAQAMQALIDGREAGLETIEEFVELLDATKEAALNAQQAKYSAFLAEKRAKKEARREHVILNAKLERHGYRWSNVGFADEEEADAFDINAPIGTSWILISPDNRTVTVAQALAEIEAK